MDEINPIADFEREKMSGPDGQKEIDENGQGVEAYAALTFLFR